MAWRGSAAERRAQRLLVAGCGQLVGLGRDEAVEERLDPGRRDRAGELGDDLPVAEGLDGGNALDAEAVREPLVAVDVDLGQLDLAAAACHGRLQRRPQGAAGAAPFGPEVDDHRQLATSVRSPAARSRLRRRRRSLSRPRIEVTEPSAPARAVSRRASAARWGHGRKPSRQAADRLARARRPELRALRRADHRAFRRRSDGHRAQPSLRDLRRRARARSGRDRRHRSPSTSEGRSSRTPWSCWPSSPIPAPPPGSSSPMSASPRPIASSPSSRTRYAEGASTPDIRAGPRDSSRQSSMPTLGSSRRRCPKELFPDDPDSLWSDVLTRMGGQFAIVARMPEDPSLN